MAAALLSLATGVPPHRHEQMTIHDQWLFPFINSQRARAIFAASQIESRYSALAMADFLADQPGTKARHDRYMAAAHPLATQLIQQALRAAHLTPANIDHFIVVSCTGFDTPGLDVLLAGELGMRPELRRSALIGMGCHAGLTALDRAKLELAAHPQSHVLILAAEFCTLHFQHGRKLDDMIAGALFGDGVAAVIVGPPANGQPQISHTRTFSDYSAHEMMGVHPSDTGFRIKLSRHVPKLLRQLVPQQLDQFLAQAGVSRQQITYWGIHPGGAKIIDYLAEALALAPQQLHAARSVLRQYGNMSSPTIFFVVEALLRDKPPQPGDIALLMTFGPGLTVEFCLLQW